MMERKYIKSNTNKKEEIALTESIKIDDLKKNLLKLKNQVMGIKKRYSKRENLTNDAENLIQIMVGITSILKIIDKMVEIKKGKR